MPQLPGGRNAGVRRGRGAAGTRTSPGRGSAGGRSAGAQAGSPWGREGVFTPVSPPLTHSLGTRMCVVDVRLTGTAKMQNGPEVHQWQNGYINCGTIT